MNEVELIVRLLLATVAGLLIGFERQNRLKAAGIRTHALVSLAAALMMIVSQFGFMATLQWHNVALDPSRVAAQIVSGISFLGAGMIIVRRESLHAIAGLTTAAGIWATAGVGMAIGAGLYVVGIAATVVLIIVQLALHYFHDFSAQQTFSVQIQIADLAQLTRFQTKLQAERMSFSVLELATHEQQIDAQLRLTVPRKLEIADVANLLATSAELQAWKIIN